MELRYIGPHEEVGVPLPDRVIVVAQNQTAVFPDDVAASLLEQESNWQDTSAADAPLAELLALSRDELNQKATDAGIDSPALLPNKKAVAEAILDAAKEDE